MKKRWLALALVFIIAMGMLAACSDSPAPPSEGGGAAPPAPGGAAPPAPGGAAPPPPAPGGSGGDSSAPPEGRPADYDTRTHIRIGAARPISGRLESYESSGFGNFYRQWVAKVNAAGGLYVEEYGRQLPIELIVYDDTSDMATMLMLTERLMHEDKVDFIFPTCSTPFITAQARLTNENGFFLFSAEGGAGEIVPVWWEYPYFFVTNSHSVHHIPAMVEFLVEQELKSVFMVYLSDQHGLEYSTAALSQFPRAGIEVKGTRPIPGDIQDLTPIIMEAMASGADAYMQFSYAGQNNPAVEIAMALDYNPKMMLFGPGVQHDTFVWAFSPEIANGIMGWGAYNEKSGPGAKAFIERFRRDEPGVAIDWWGSLFYEVVLEMFEQAIGIAGTLDNTVIAETFANTTFQTTVGPVWYENNSIARECYMGNIGQWQYDAATGTIIYEVVDVNPSQRTGQPLVPKPPWPR